MELDKLKTAWSQSNNTDNYLNPDNIKKMLRNESNGTLNKIMYWEKVSMWICMVATPFFWGIMFLNSCLKNGFDNKYLYICITFTIVAAYSIISQGSKLKYLKKTDMLNMDILTVSTRMAKYKKFALYEMAISIVCVIPLIVFMLWVMLGSNEPMYVYMIFAVYTLVLIAIAILIYRTYYFKKLQAIQSTLKEIKEFEEEE